MKVGRCQAWLRASLNAATLAGLILIAACWGIAAFVTDVEREKAVDGMHRQSDDMLRLFEENTVEVLDRIDRTLLLLRDSYEQDPKHFDLRSWATRTALLIDETFQISLMVSVASSLNRLRTIGAHRSIWAIVTIFAAKLIS